LRGGICLQENFVESGRPDSNRRRPAWEAGILPLNYARGTVEGKAEAAEAKDRPTC
jgi:hypothetical protein